MTARRIGWLAWIAFGLAVAWLSRAQGLGTAQEPGPGMLGFALGLLMAGLGAAHLLASASRRAQDAPAGSAAAAFLSPRVLLLCGLLAAYIALFEPVGFLLSTMALLLVLLVGLGGMRWLPSLAISAGAAALSYVVFKQLLGTQLPAGLLG